MTKQEFLLSHPYYHIKEEERIGKIKEYFTNLRYSIISTCIPNILVKENSLEYQYPSYINDAISHINNLEQLSLLNN